MESRPLSAALVHTLEVSPGIATLVDNVLLETAFQTTPPLSHGHRGGVTAVCITG